jgi:hypothetical protein
VYGSCMTGGAEKFSSQILFLGPEKLYIFFLALIVVN